MKMDTSFWQALLSLTELQYEGGLDLKKVQCEAKYTLHCDYFKAIFNLPLEARSDVCCQCTVFDDKIKVDKNSCQEDPGDQKTAPFKEGHKQKAKVFISKLKYLSSVVKEKEDSECICFHFKQSTQFPIAPTGNVFSLPQVWLFFFGIHSTMTGKSKMYTWPKMQAK